MKMCDSCRDGHHENCVEATFPYDHQGVDLGSACECACIRKEHDEEGR